MANTLAEVYEKVYDLMGEKTTSTTYTINSTVALINSYIDRICKGQIISLLNPNSKYRAGNLSFLEKKVYYTNINYKPTAVATAIGDITLTIDTIGFPTTGKFMINGEIGNYTGKTSTELTGVTGITAIHPIASKVFLVFTLPTGIAKPFQVFDTKGYEIPYQDFRYNDMSKYYTILTDRDPTTSKPVDYLYFNNCNFNNYLVKYYEKPTKLVYGTDDDVEIILPDDYGLTVIASLVAGELKYTKGEEIDLAQNNLNNGYSALQEMLDYYSQKAIKYRKGINITQPGDYNLVNNNRWLYDDDKRF